MQDSLPQSVRKLLGVLEKVEKVVANSNAKEKAAKESAEKATGKRNKGKRKGTSSNDIRVPKKARAEKSKHGGAHTRKYDKDGTLQKSFSAKAAVGQKRHGGGKKESYNSFMQVMERSSKLEKAVKKSHKSARKMKHRHESRDTSDSDSE